MKISKIKILIAVTALCLVAVIVVVSLFNGTQDTFSLKEFERYYKSATVVPEKTMVSWNDEGYTKLGENQWLLLEFDNMHNSNPSFLASFTQLMISGNNTFV